MNSTISGHFRGHRNVAILRSDKEDAMTIFGSQRTKGGPDFSVDRDPYLEGLARQMLRLRERTLRHTRPSF